MIRALLPHPLLALGLFVTSLLMSGSVEPPALALAAVLALATPQVMRALDAQTIRIRSPGAIVSLAGCVVVDVLRSNWAVAAIILGRRRHERRSGFIHVPLDLKDRYALAVLAVILTATPGTLWVEYDSATGRLLLHVLDLVEEDEWIRLIKDRYERRLMEIFE
ncbi:Na+/H+ antiporter subunit E [Caulobacter sp. 602-2]|uniref:Na+/H+ antiporter subunit E n=1 Tax=Caulobacter sp. 602-2 TaxID=2710887 RepID=A0A6G4QTH8_9CAUL|nr:Na+/H+ antiporter subunit E [Caulobacter sp. 602-2]NGM48832.1 Na+/H+ antiporter subunit E [Caulobacter sp. 602-2]